MNHDSFACVSYDTLTLMTQQNFGAASSPAHSPADDADQLLAEAKNVATSLTSVSHLMVEPASGTTSLTHFPAGTGAAAAAAAASGENNDGNQNRLQLDAASLVDAASSYSFSTAGALDLANVAVNTLTSSSSSATSPGDVTPALSNDTYTFNFGDAVNSPNRKTSSQMKQELKRSIQKGARYNIKMNAKYQAARGYGFKGAMSLKQINGLADAVAEKKILNQPLSGKVEVEEKKLLDRTQLLKFRAGVNGRRNVKEHFAEKEEQQRLGEQKHREDLYGLYTQQQASYSAEPAGNKNTNKSNIDNNGDDEAEVTEVQAHIDFGLGHGAIADRRCTGGNKQAKREAAEKKTLPASTSSSVPTTPSIEISIKPRVSDNQSSTSSSSSSSSSSSIKIAEAARQKIWCDHEMCRKKFGKVEEAVFWSKQSNQTYCTYCWELISSHQPHNLLVDYDEKKKDVRAKRDEDRENNGGREEGEEKEEEDGDPEEQEIATTHASINTGPLSGGFYNSSLSGREDGEHRAPEDMMSTLNSMYTAVGNKKPEFVDREADVNGINLGHAGGISGKTAATTTTTATTAKRQIKGTGEYRTMEGVPKGAAAILTVEKDRLGMANETSNGINYAVLRGRSHVSDGSLKTPTLHVNAKVKISYMSDETRRGMTGIKKSMSRPELGAAEARRRRLQETKKIAKAKRVAEKGGEGGGGAKLQGGATVKSAAGISKDPLVLECTTMSASGLKAGGAGYAPPDFAIPMTGISKFVQFDDENATVDGNLSRGIKPSKKKVVKVIHGVPVYFRDEESALSGEELRALKKSQSAPKGNQTS